MTQHYGVQKQKLKQLSKKEYQALRMLFHLSKNMFNVGLYNVRQHFFKTGEYRAYKDNYHDCKTNENYKLMGSAAAQQTLKQVEECFLSFFKLLKTKGQKPRIPSYLEKEGFFGLSYPQFKIQPNGRVELPMSPAFKREYGKVSFSFPTNLKKEQVCEIRLLPKYNARYIEVEYVYRIDIETPELNPDHALAIDLGLNNLATCVTTLGTSFILDGKHLKSINRRYNKENARLQSQKDKQGLTHFTFKQVQLVTKRNNRIRDILNKSARYLINHCLDNGIGKLVVGYNKGWKNKTDLSSLFNQKFAQIPHGQLIAKLEQLAKRSGILFQRQEEAYTSKVSFLDNEAIQKHDIYLGKRIHRGLFQTADGRLLNADVNAAANILRKSNHETYLSEVAKGILTFPLRIRCLPV